MATLSALDDYLCREIFAFCGVEDLLRLENVSRKCLAQSAFAWTWRRKDSLMNRIRLCADDQYIVERSLSSPSSSRITKLSDKAIVIRIYRAYLEGRTGLLLLGAQFGSQVHSTHNCMLDVFPSSGSESESDSTRMYDKTFVGDHVARAGLHSTFRYPGSILPAMTNLFGTTIGASTAFQNVFGQWEVLGGWCNEHENEHEIDFANEEEEGLSEEEGEEGEGEGAQSNEGEMDDVVDDEEDEEEDNFQQPEERASSTNLVLNMCTRTNNQSFDFKQVAQCIGNTTHMSFEYDNDVFTSLARKEEYYNTKLVDFWYSIQPRLPRELCYAAACSTNQGHAICTGGAFSPYQGAAVYSQCYYRGVDKLKEFNCLYQQRLEALRNRQVGVHAHRISLYEEEAELMTEIDALPSLWQGDVIADLLEPRCGHNLLCLSSHGKMDASTFSLDIAYDEPLSSNEGTQAVPTCAADIFSSKDNAPFTLNNEMIGSISIDGHLVAVGGYGGGATYYRSGEIYSLETNQWYSLPIMKDGRSGSAACVHPHCPYTTIVVAGGSSDGTNQLKSAELLDIRMKSWAKLPPMHHHRGYCGAGAVDIYDRFWVTGGLKNGFGGCNKSIECFDFRMLKWTEENNEQLLDAGPMFGKAAHHTLNIFY